MSATTQSSNNLPEQLQANATTKALQALESARKKDAEAVTKQKDALLAQAKAVEEFGAKWSGLDAQAKGLLRECWEFDHRKAERSQSFRHCLYMGVLALAWLALLVCAIRCLEAPLSDMGKYGAVVLCVFLVVAISVPASVIFCVMKSKKEE